MFGDSPHRHRSLWKVYLDARHGAVPFQYVMSPEGGSYWSSGNNPSVTQQELGGPDLPIGKTRTQGAVRRVDDVIGFDRTAETIRNGCKKDLTAPQLLDYLINEVKQFAGNTPQGDDQTVVVLAVER